MVRPILFIVSLAFAPLVLRADAPATSASKTNGPAVKLSLVIGAEAPALRPEKWLQGEPVAAFEPGKVYIVECWATWCGPCLAMIPHMNELHEKFKDQGLVVIGANVWGDTEEKAAAFVARKGDKMAYRVAYDGETGNIVKDWLEAANLNGIPHAFVIRDGRLFWHGHPKELTAENVRSLIKGGPLPTQAPGDLAKAREAFAKRQSARLDVLAQFRAGDADKALTKVFEHEKVLAESDPGDPDLLRAMAYSIKGDKEQSLAHYRNAAKAANGHPGALFRVAHGLLDYGTVRDNELARQCAREAAKKDDNHFVRHMLARAEAAAGNKKAAIAILEKIAEEEDSDQYRAELRALKEGAEVPPPAARSPRH